MNILKNKLRGSLVEGKYLFTSANQGVAQQFPGCSPQGSQGEGIAVEREVVTGKRLATAATVTEASFS